MSAVLFLAEVEAHDGAGVVTHRFASKGWAGPAAPGFYDGRMMGAPTIRRTAWAPGRTSGTIEQAIGALELANADGALDALADQAFDDRPVRILVGDPGAPYSAFVPFFTGTCEQAAFGLDRITLRLRDGLFSFDKPASPNTYAGTNAGAAGVEGLPDTIKGRRKPRAWGRSLGVPPVQVNSVIQAWQVSDGPVAAVTVEEGGLPIAAGAPYVSLADLMATAPAAGTVRLWAGGGLFRLGSAPSLPLAADVDEGATAGDRTAAQVLRRVALAAGVPTDRIDTADAAVLDAVQAGPVGWWTEGEGTFLDAASGVADGVGAWCGFDARGRFRVRRLELPGAAEPAATFRVARAGVALGAQDADIVDMERLALADDGRGVPAARVTIRWGRRRVTLERGRGLAGAVTAAREAELREEWRNATPPDLAAVRARHLRASELTFDSGLLTEAAALAEAARRLALHGARRDRLRVRTVLSPALAAAVDLGSPVAVAGGRYGQGVGAGRPMVVIGITTGVDPLVRPDLVDLEFWG